MNRYARSPVSGDPKWMHDQAARIGELAAQALPYAERDAAEQIALGGNPGFYDGKWVGIQARVYATEAYRRMKTVEEIAGPLRPEDQELVERATCGRRAA